MTFRPFSKTLNFRKALYRLKPQIAAGKKLLKSICCHPLQDFPNALAFVDMRKLTNHNVLLFFCAPFYLLVEDTTFYVREIKWSDPLGN